MTKQNQGVPNNYDKRYKLHTGNINGSGMFGLLGTIDEARIYNQALSSMEISLLADFNNEESELDRLVAQLKLDKTSGTQTSDSLVRNPGTSINGAFLETVDGELGDGVTFDENYNFLAIANYEDIKIGLSTPQKITADNDHFNYSGRIDWENSQAPAFSYPGTAVKFKFTGTSLKIELSEDNLRGENYIDVYIDGNPNPTTIKLRDSRQNKISAIQSASIRKIQNFISKLLNRGSLRQKYGQPIVYDIAEGLENKVHNVVLIKRNDYLTGEFKFHSIIIDGELLPAAPDSERKIEVYGDSISAGTAVEYEVAGVIDPQRNNNDLANAYYSYASILARNYDAELSIVAQSGASLVNGFGYWNNGTGAETFYDKLKPLGNAPSWDFSNYTPDLVIIALGQNDSSTIKIGRDISKKAWKERYKQFIANLRAKYPDSYFVGMFPNMYHDRKWDTYLTEAIAEYRSEYNDNRVFSLIHEQVTPGHPRISEQQLMADTLREFIDGTLSDRGFNWDVAD